MQDRYDVIVIGGGVSGCSAAFFLASDPGFDGRLLVVERDPTYQDAPSARATGGIRQQFSTPENVRIGLFGAHFVKNAGDYLAIDGEAPDLAWREGGYLLLATRETLPVMRENNAVQRAEGADVALPRSFGARAEVRVAQHRWNRGGLQRPERGGVGGPLLVAPGISPQGPGRSGSRSYTTKPSASPAPERASSP